MLLATGFCWVWAAPAWFVAATDGTAKDMGGCGVCDPLRESVVRPLRVWIKV